MNLNEINSICFPLFIINDKKKYLLFFFTFDINVKWYKIYIIIFNIKIRWKKHITRVTLFTFFFIPSNK
jgi:hypothetical protein